MKPNNISTFVKGRYTDFSDVANPELRAYNQARVAVNLLEDFGKEYAAAYFQSLNQADLPNVKGMLVRFNKDGMEETARQVQITTRDVA